MNSQIAYQNEKIETKKVYFTGSDVLKEGYALCFDADRGTAASEDPLRAYYVEKPSAANARHFAGLVTGAGEGKQGPCHVEVHVPNARGQKVRAWSAVANVIDVTRLRLQDASFALGTEGGLPVVALAMQTVDRSSTAGTVQALLHGLDAMPASEASEQFAAKGRTAAQLPTAAIWQNFDIQQMRSNGFGGTLLEHDFDRPNTVLSSAVEGTTVATPFIRGAAAIGEGSIFITADNEGAALLFQAPIVVSGGRPWALEARIKASTIDDTKAGFIFGLIAANVASVDHVADDGTITDGGFVGFQNKEGDGDILDAVYDAAGQAQNEHDDDWATLVADTYVKVGMYFNGTTITLYLNGVASGSVIAAADIAAADFPAGAVLVPVLAMKGAAADDKTVTMDWIRAAQAP